MSHPATISATFLFQHFQKSLNWQWVAGLQAGGRQFETSTRQAASLGSDLVGYLNDTHPYCAQILGEREVAFLNAAEPNALAKHIAHIVELQPLVLTVADGQTPPPALLQMAEEAQIPLFVTAERATIVVDTLHAYFSRHFAPCESMHGVLLDILSLGVLITGESGIGKSELGLELISRGNRLVADDVVDLYRINQDCIEARCPELLQNLLEVRGIGLLNICALFGETAVRRHKRLQLIVHLVRKAAANDHYERLPTQPLYQNILGLPVRKIIIEVQAGRNLAVLVEAAVRNTILELRGINTYEEFTARQRKAMQQGNA